MITSKESTLLGVMQDMGYSIGLINTTLHLVCYSKEAMDEMLLYILDNHPGEEEVMEYLAEVVQKTRGKE